jgi:hypothetical protein
VYTPELEELMRGWQPIDLAVLRREAEEVDESAWLDELAEKVKNLVGEDAIALCTDHLLGPGVSVGQVVDVDHDAYIHIVFSGGESRILSLCEPFALYRRRDVAVSSPDALSSLEALRF